MFEGIGIGGRGKENNGDWMSKYIASA
jgi:hypothetical protein